MQVYTKIIKVAHDDLDALNHVNNVRYVQWVNDIAQEHWQLKTTSQTRKDYFWVMLNHNINYKVSAVLGETLELKTFVLKSEGVTSTRVVEIYNLNTQKLLARSETHWCLMSQKTLRPIRIPDEIKTLFE